MSSCKIEAKFTICPDFAAAKCMKRKNTPQSFTSASRRISSSRCTKANDRRSSARSAFGAATTPANSPKVSRDSKSEAGTGCSCCAPLFQSNGSGDPGCGNAGYSAIVSGSIRS